MSVAQTRAAARKMKHRYRRGRATLSVAEAIRRERNRAAAEARRAASKKSK